MLTADKNALLVAPIRGHTTGRSSSIRTKDSSSSNSNVGIPPNLLNLSAAEARPASPSSVSVTTAGTVGRGGVSGAGVSGAGVSGAGVSGKSVGATVKPISRPLM